MDKDFETAKVLNEGDRLARYVKSDDYRLIKGMLMNKITALDSLTALPTEGMTAEQIVRDMTARAGAIVLIRQWLAEIEGIANQAIHTAEIMTKVEEDSIIKRHE